MSTTYSTSLRLALMGTGDQSGTWGNTTNTNLGTLLEQSISGVRPISLTGLTTYTLQAYNGTLDDARSMVLVFTGSPSATVTIVAPLVNKIYIIVNLCGQTINMTATGGSTSLAIPYSSPGLTAQCYCDAANATGLGAGFYSSQTGSAGNFVVNGTLSATGESDTGNLSVGGNLSVTGTTALTGTATAPTPSTGDNSTKIATTAFVSTSNLVMSGTIQMWPTSSAPTGYLICNGVAISRTTYATLFGILGTTFGTGDGSTTFNLPNYTNAMPIGAGGTYALAATGGSATTTIGLTNLPPHDHSITDPGHSHTYATYSAIHQDGGSTLDAMVSPTTQSTGTSFTSISVNNTQKSGSAFANTAMNTISPYLGIYFIIKT